MAWDRTISSGNEDVHAVRVTASGVPSGSVLNIDTSSDTTERPAVTYSPAAAVYLAAWNNRTNGSAYTRRYSPTTPPAPSASFTASPTSGPIPLTITFTDTSSGTIASRT